MTEKTFLVIDEILIPDMESESLKIYQKDLDIYLRMISGRSVCESRGYIWMIEADFSDIDTALLQQLHRALNETKVHNIAFLPPDGSGEITSDEFHLTSRPEPKLKSWQEELPEWSGLSYVFEGVRPHD